jgi:hypothetical protein
VPQITQIGRVIVPVADRDVDVDDELMGGDGTVPLPFFFRDRDANQLMIVQRQ